MENSAQRLDSQQDDTSSTTSDQLEIHENSMLRDALPEIALTTSITGPYFMVSIEAEKELGKLQFRRLCVTGLALDGTPTMKFEFDAPLEAKGVEHLATVLGGSTPSMGIGFLRSVLSFTESYSCGTWRTSRIAPSQSAQTDATALTPRCPTFSSFCDDPGVLSRHFECRYERDGKSLLLEADIAASSELLHLRIAEDTEHTGQVHGDALKVLLPFSSTRTIRSAYDDLKVLLSHLAHSFQLRGFEGLMQTLGELELDVMPVPLLEHDGQESGVPPRYKRAILGSIGSVVRDDSSGEVQYTIDQVAAVVSLMSSRGNVSSGIRLEFQPGAGYKSFTATQIRYLHKCIDLLVGKQVPRADWEGDSLVARVIAACGHSSDTNNHKTGVLSHPHLAENPGKIALRALEIRPVIIHPGAGYFLSDGGLRQLILDRTFIEDRVTTPPVELIGNVLNGGRHLILSATHEYVQAHPHFFRCLAVAESPGGALYTRVFNSLGGSHACVLDPSYNGTLEIRAETITALYKAMTTQHLYGPRAVTQRMRELSDDVGPAADLSLWDPRNIALPSPDDEVGWRNLDTIGTAAHMMRRAGLPALETTCEDRGGGVADVRIESRNLKSSFDIRFSSSKICSITARHFEELKDNNFAWLEGGTFLHPGFELEGSNLCKIVEALRSYMRDKVDSQAVRSGRPQLFAYQNLAQSLEALRFEQRK